MIDTEVMVGAVWEEHQGLRGCSSPSTTAGIECRKYKCGCKQMLFPHLKTNKHAHMEEPTDERSTLIFIRHTSKVVRRVITPRLPPASVSLIFRVRLLHNSPPETATWVHVSCYRSRVLQPGHSWSDHLCSYPNTKTWWEHSCTLGMLVFLSSVHVQSP